MKNNNRLGIRLIFYFAGLAIMAFGVALSVKSDLGVSPISSIPYTMTCVAGIELGRATIIFSAFMVLVQAVLLRTKFKLFNLLQLPVGILFGLWMTFCSNMVMALPPLENATLRFILMLVSTVVIALGVFMYVPAGFIPLAPEGAMLVVAQMTKSKFANVKLISDISMVAISTVVCLIILGELGSVGIGTIAAAVLVGNEIKVLGKYFGAYRDKILGIGQAASATTKQAAEKPLLQLMKRDVYTIHKDDTIADALKMMKAKKVSGLPVLDQEERLAGFISDGDIIRHLTSEHSLFIDSHSLEKIEFNAALHDLMKHPVSSLATKRVIAVNAKDSLDEVCYVLGEHRLKKAPVMENGEMIGIINVSNIIGYAVSLMEEPA